MANESRPALNALKQWERQNRSIINGAWPSGLGRTHGVREIAGSNPVVPIKIKTLSGVFLLPDKAVIVK